MFGGNETFTGDINTITPEISNDIEFGISSNQKNVIYNINFYYMWFKNELILNGKLGMNGLPCHENAKNSYRTGIEGNVNLNIFDKLYFDFNGSYSINKVLSETFGKKTHILTPNSTLDCDLKWVDNIWNIGINTNHHSSMFIDMNNNYTVPHLFSINLYGGAKINNIEIGMRFNNITNKTNYCTGMLGANDDVLYIKNAGFNVNFSLKINF
jgi:iron complex outermembrane receptor protein